MTRSPQRTTQLRARGHKHRRLTPSRFYAQSSPRNARPLPTGSAMRPAGLPQRSQRPMRGNPLPSMCGVPLMSRHLQTATPPRLVRVAPGQYRARPRKGDYLGGPVPWNPNAKVDDDASTAKGRAA